MEAFFRDCSSPSYSAGLPDERTARIPCNTLVQGYIARSAYSEYPYPGENRPKLLLGRNNDLVATKDSIDIENTIVHSLERTSCMATDTINILGGSLLVGQNVVLRASIVKIYDDDRMPLRTSVVAQRSLAIKADQLIVDGADIVQPTECSIRVGRIECKNTTETTEWLKSWNARRSARSHSF